MSGAIAAPVKTALVQTDGKWQLLRDGNPYVIKGAAGGASKQMLAEVGRKFRIHIDRVLGYAANGRRIFRYDVLQLFRVESFFVAVQFSTNRNQVLHPLQRAYRQGFSRVD